MVCPVTIVILMTIMIVRLVSATMVPTLIPILPIIILVVMAENRVTSKQQWRIPLKKNIDLGKTFFYVSINTDEICMGFEADTPEK